MARAWGSPDGIGDATSGPPGTGARRSSATTTNGARSPGWFVTDHPGTVAGGFGAPEARPKSGGLPVHPREAPGGCISKPATNPCRGIPGASFHQSLRPRDAAGNPIVSHSSGSFDRGSRRGSTARGPCNAGKFELFGPMTFMKLWPLLNAVPLMARQAPWPHVDLRLSPNGRPGTRDGERCGGTGPDAVGRSVSPRGIRDRGDRVSLRR